MSKIHTGCRKSGVKKIDKRDMWVLVTVCVCVCVVCVCVRGKLLVSFAMQLPYTKFGKLTKRRSGVWNEIEPKRVKSDKREPATNSLIGNSIKAYHPPRPLQPPPPPPPTGGKKQRKENLCTYRTQKISKRIGISSKTLLLLLPPARVDSRVKGRGGGWCGK